MTFFNNTTVDVYEYDESTSSFNIYGEPDEVYNLVDTVKCDFQPNSPNETVEMEGTIYTDTYKVYLPLTTQVTRTCRLRINGECYDIIGSPQRYDHFLKHIKCTLIKHRK